MYSGYIHMYFYARKNFKFTPARAWQYALKAYKKHGC